MTALAFTEGERGRGKRSRMRKSTREGVGSSRWKSDGGEDG